MYATVYHANGACQSRLPDLAVARGMPSGIARWVGPDLFRPISRRGALTQSRRLALGLSAVALLMSTVDSTIVATALPSIARDLRTSFGWGNLTVTAYLAGLTIAMPIGGKLSDAKGRKRTFLTFVATFTIASALCGASTNIVMLVTFRFLQALGGGGFMPSVIGLAADYFPRNRERVVGLVSTVFPMGALIGPVAGGAIVSLWTWRLVFLVNVPIGLGLMLSLAHLLARDDAPMPARVDYVGCVLLATALLGLICGFNLLDDSSLGMEWAVAPVFLAGLSGAAFVVRLGRVDNPVVAPQILRRNGFLVINSLNLVYGASANGIFTLVPLFAQLAYGVAPLQAGMLLSIRAVGMIATATVSALSLPRTGYRLPMIAGFLAVSGGLATLSLSPIGRNPYLTLCAGALAGGIGVGLAGPASNNAAIELLPEEAAAISGLRGMFRQVGGVIAISTLSLFNLTGDTSSMILRAGFGGLAIVMLLALPAITRIRENRADQNRV